MRYPVDVEPLRVPPEVQRSADLYRTKLRRRLLALRPEVSEPGHDPTCGGLDELFVRRDPRRTCAWCEDFREEIERVEAEPLGLWQKAD